MHRTLLGSSSAALVLAASALAQHPLQVSAQVIAASGQAVPGVPGAVFGGAGYFEVPAVDDSGNVLFRGRFFGGGVGTGDDRAWFYGAPGNLALVAQGGSQAPGQPTGVTLSTSAGAPGMTSLYRIGANGHMLAVSSLWNGGITSANDTALIVGTPSSLSTLVQESDAAPGTTNAQFSADLTTTTVVSAPTSGANASGQYLFRSQIAGGDVVGTTNNEGWWLGAPGNLQLLVRKADVMPDSHAIFSFTGTGTTSNNFAKLNAAGQVLWECIYNSAVGSPLPTGTTNQALYRSTLGGAHVLIAREGDPVPGLAGGEVFGIVSGASSWGALGAALDAQGNVLFSPDIRDGATTTSDDQVLAYWPSGGAVQVLARENDPAPGLAGVQLASINPGTLMLGNQGRFSFIGNLRGAVGTGSDSALWSGLTSAPGGALQLVAREGDPAPGTSNALIGGLSSTVYAFNDLGTLVFVTGLVAGDVVVGVNDAALYQWTPSNGLELLARKGDLMPQLGNQPILGWSVYGNDNSGGSSLGLSAGNRLVLRLIIGSDQAIVSYDIPYTSTPTSYCTAGTTTAGCTAQIGATGTPSISAASGFTLAVNGVEGQRTGLIFYGTDNSGFTPAPWSASSSSFLCVKPPTQRTPSQTSGGTTGACDGSFTLDWLAFLATHPSALGQPFQAGTTVYAQAWFRDPPAPKTTNLSDALQLVTLP
ncbi:MAG: hypothetical protein IT184_13155 [Acidobacteria bacterium]|nr:hypothetical protein [Acidobacteriota bacterium]